MATTRHHDNAEFWRIVQQGERARAFESGELVSAGDAPFGFGNAALTRAAWEATGAADPERLLVVLASAKVAMVFHLVCAKRAKTGRLLYSAGPFAPDCSRVPLLVVSTRDDEGRRATTFMLPDEAPEAFALRVVSREARELLLDSWRIYEQVLEGRFDGLLGRLQ